ncbi:LolA family protein [Amaricoccus solimangrovi]|uniref:Outer membrane lipoprotein carrier protein LolA n=1 Tax=Amaricoccus solimangrovi TaxID=2589815 RepID=A0A501WUW4_9RHOB|nr:outer-membrane lipoprotein carrier protein LolA [Amaricoccus solimangrovi]TPE53198.1 outer membrane lipoprotein carrier protein LolA [Amaricoccus solimangrovi]
MKRRDLLRAALALPLLGSLGAPALAQPVDVTAIDAYLRGLRVAQGRFRQTNPNGSTQTGTFTLAKPGRIRFEYDAPKGAMVIADGSWVGVFDPKSNRGPTRYPLSKTPLSLLLRDDISLAEPGMVLGATRDADGTTDITVVDPKARDEGRIVMRFGADPIALRGWQVITRTGQRTSVQITSLDTRVRPSRSLFNIELATANRR